jgi:hypothetical protein
VVFDESHNVISSSNLVEILVSLGGLLLNDKVRLRSVLPGVLNIVQVFLNLFLLLGFVSDVYDNVLKVKEFKLEYFFEGEFITSLVEFLFDLKSESLPMAFTDRIMSKVGQELHSRFEVLEPLVEGIIHGPRLVLVADKELLQLSMELVSSVCNFSHF